MYDVIWKPSERLCHFTGRRNFIWILKIKKQIFRNNQQIKSTAATWVDNIFRFYHPIISRRRQKNPSMVPFSFFLMLFKLLGKLSNGWNFPKPNSYSILASLMGYFWSMAYLKPRFRDFLLESEVSSISKLVLISLWNLQTLKKWRGFR